MSGDVPLIELRGVSRTYSSPRSPQVRALRRIDLQIFDGEFVAIVGPSGGGKTTLMNVLGLLDDPTEGDYLLEGQPVRVGAGRRSAALRARSIGFVFQAFHLLEGRPAIDSVELTLLYRGIPRRQRRERAKEALERVGLGDRAEQSTSTLSGGQRQRTAIARAIAAGARVILADEPTGNLDSRSAELILDELQRLNEGGATIVVVTHSPEVAARAHRIVRITDGVLDSDVTHHEPPARGVFRPVAGTADPSARVRASDILRDAWASVLSRGFQSLGQGFAVAVAVALTITTLGLSASATAQVSATFDAHLNREVSATWSTRVAHSPPLPDVPGMTESLAGVDAAAVLLDKQPVSVATFADARTVRPHIAVGDIAAAARLTVVEASWHHGPLRSDEVFVGDLLAEQLQLGMLERAPALSIDGVSYVVAGLITESSRLPLLRGEVIVGAPADLSAAGPIDVTVLVVTMAGAAPQVADQLPRALNPFQPDAITVTAPTDSAVLRGQVEQGVQVTLIAFTLLALVAAIAALMNATLLAVHARRGEIGMRKAVGAGDRHIAALITTESALIGVLGGVAGLVLGMVAILVVTISQHWSPVFDVALMPLAIASGLLVGAGGGGVAAIRAARLRPAENLRT